MTNDLPDGYLDAFVMVSPLGALVPCCRRCGALIAPAREGQEPTPFQVHDAWHDNLVALAVGSSVGG